MRISALLALEIFQVRSLSCLVPFLLLLVMKGRLPIDNLAIDNALDLGLSDCLRQLQITNPSLLLTASELKKAERDSRFVPSVAAAMASVLANSKTTKENTLNIIRNWGMIKESVEESHAVEKDSVVLPTPSDTDLKDMASDQIPLLVSYIEERMRLVILFDTPAGTSTHRKKSDIKEDSNIVDQRQPSPQSQQSVSVAIDWDMLNKESSEECDNEHVDTTNALAYEKRKKLKSIVSETVPKKSNNKIQSDDASFEDWF
jgi:hypothetical protein